MNSTGLMIEAVELQRSFIAKEAVAGISFDVGQGEPFGTGVAGNFRLGAPPPISLLAMI